MNILSMTGWQQPADALAEIVPDANHFDYGRYDSKDALYGALQGSCDIAIGWSLGGQLLVQAIAQGILKAQKLILLSAPFQQQADTVFPQGADPKLLWEFRASYIQNPMQAMEQFCALMGLHDSKAARITRTLQRRLAVWPNGIYWLDMLLANSCHGLDYSAFPPTLIIHGREDAVVSVPSAHEFSKQIRGANKEIIPECGHAPHLHDAGHIRELVAPYV